MGKDDYPTDITSAYSLLVNYRTPENTRARNPTPASQPAGSPEASAMTFTQRGAIASINGVVHHKTSRVTTARTLGTMQATALRHKERRTLAQHWCNMRTCLPKQMRQISTLTGYFWTRNPQSLCSRTRKCYRTLEAVHMYSAH